MKDNSAIIQSRQGLAWTKPLEPREVSWADWDSGEEQEAMNTTVAQLEALQLAVNHLRETVTQDPPPTKREPKTWAQIAAARAAMPEWSDWTGPPRQDGPVDGHQPGPATPRRHYYDDI